MDAIGDCKHSLNRTGVIHSIDNRTGVSHSTDKAAGVSHSIDSATGAKHSMEPSANLTNTPALQGTDHDLCAAISDIRLKDDVKIDSGRPMSMDKMIDLHAGSDDDSSAGKPGVVKYPMQPVHNSETEAQAYWNPDLNDESFESTDWADEVAPEPSLAGSNSDDIAYAMATTDDLGGAGYGNEGDYAALLQELSGPTDVYATPRRDMGKHEDWMAPPGAYPAQRPPGPREAIEGYPAHKQPAGYMGYDGPAPKVTPPSKMNRGYRSPRSDEVAQPYAGYMGYDGPAPKTANVSSQREPFHPPNVASPPDTFHYLEEATPGVYNYPDARIEDEWVAYNDSPEESEERPQDPAEWFDEKIGPMLVRHSYVGGAPPKIYAKTQKNPAASGSQSGCALCGNHDHDTRGCKTVQQYAPSLHKPGVKKSNVTRGPKQPSTFGQRVFCTHCGQPGHTSYACPNQEEHFNFFKRRYNKTDDDYRY